MPPTTLFLVPGTPGPGALWLAMTCSVLLFIPRPVGRGRAAAQMAAVTGRGRSPLRKTIAALAFSPRTCEPCRAPREPRVQFLPLPPSTVRPVVACFPPKPQFSHPHDAAAKNIYFVDFYFYFFEQED